MLSECSAVFYYSIKCFNVYADMSAMNFIKMFWSLTDSIQYVNDECWNITAILLKFHCVKSDLRTRKDSVFAHLLRWVCLLGQTTKQPLSKFGHWKSWKYKQFEGPDPSCL